MRTLAEVENDIDIAVVEQHHWKDREEELLDERVEIEDAIALREDEEQEEREVEDELRDNEEWARENDSLEG